MNPSMRYHSAKLSQLVHEEKAYRLHISSVDKIMNKTSSEFMRRSQRLQELKNRKQQSFNYNQYKRSKQIGELNSILFSKIVSESKVDKKFVLSPSDSLQAFQQKIQARNREQHQKAEKKTHDKHFVLRNHKKSPIHKSTLLERTRQNIRLAKKIVNPVITYKTQNYLKEYQNKSHYKERIMKYEPYLARPKAELYVDKRLSHSFFNKEKSISSHNSLFFSKNKQEKNPEILSKQED